MGRKKITVSKIDNERTRNITFNKRKSGLIKKAMELSILCDCEISLVVFSKENGEMSNLYEYSSSDPRLILQKYCTVSGLAHERYTNDDYELFNRRKSRRKHGNSEKQENSIQNSEPGSTSMKQIPSENVIIDDVPEEIPIKPKTKNLDRSNESNQEVTKIPEGNFSNRSNGGVYFSADIPAKKRRYHINRSSSSSVAIFDGGKRLPSIDEALSEDQVLSPSQIMHPLQRTDDVANENKKMDGEMPTNGNEPNNYFGMANPSTFSPLLFASSGQTPRSLDLGLPNSIGTLNTPTYDPSPLTLGTDGEGLTDLGTNNNNNNPNLENLNHLEENETSNSSGNMKTL